MYYITNVISNISMSTAVTTQESYTTLIQKIYQFINVVNRVGRSHKTANMCFSYLKQ